MNESVGPSAIAFSSVEDTSEQLVSRCNPTIACQSELIEMRVADAKGHEIKPAVKTSREACARGVKSDPACKK